MSARILNAASVVARILGLVQDDHVVGLALDKVLATFPALHVHSHLLEGSARAPSGLYRFI